MFKRISLFFFIGALVTLNSCETDFSLNGDYQIQPVVFGLLDHTKDFHTVKITKAYLGDGDNLVYAKNPDSNYFNQVDATIREYIDNVFIREWTLFDTTIANKDISGLFYAPDQKVYAFFADDLDSTAEYELLIDLENGAHLVTGRTTMMDKFKLTGSLLNPAYRIAFAPLTVVDDQDYDNWNFTVNEGLHAARYNYKYTFRWTETYADNSTATFSATRNNGDIFQTNAPSNPLTHQAVFSGLDFYEWVGTVLVDDPTLVKRQMNGLDLKISVAHEDLNQYMQVGEPISGIAQVQPEYTNLTGSRGLFSSRIIFEFNDFKLNPSSMKELCIGLYTGGRYFCSDYPEHIGESFYCP